MLLPIITKQRAIKLRQKGYSLGEISKMLSISQSTASLWLRDIKLDHTALQRIEMRRMIGKENAIKFIRNKQQSLYKQQITKITNKLSSITPNDSIYQLLCSFLYWAEGSKDGTHVTFVNSDPLMIRTFLNLFRKSFDLDERKFRASVHIHEYHQENEIKKFWSEVSCIPLEQFNRSYYKAHTGSVKRKDYKGCFRIRYYDAKIAKYLTLLYKTFATEYVDLGL